MPSIGLGGRSCLRWSALLWVLAHPCGAASDTTSTALTVLYRHRAFVAASIRSCEYQTLRTCEPCSARSESARSLLIYSDSSFAAWKRAQLKLLGGVLSICNLTARGSRTGAAVTKNREYVEILAALLTSDGGEPVLQYLLRNTSYRTLDSCAILLKDALRKAPRLRRGYAQRLMALLPLTDTDRAWLGPCASLPLCARVRFGDRSAEAQLIAQYEAEKRYRDKRRLVDELLWAGSDACVKTLLRHFNEPIFDTVPEGKPRWFRAAEGRLVCLRESIRYPILVGLRRLHPEEQLLGNFLDRPGRPTSGEVSSHSPVELYLDSVDAWIEKQYGLRPADPSPMPFVVGDCYIP
jgi:hypothetical protein